MASRVFFEANQAWGFPQPLRLGSQEEGPCLKGIPENVCLSCGFEALFNAGWVPVGALWYVLRLEPALQPPRQSGGHFREECGMARMWADQSMTPTLAVQTWESKHHLWTWSSSSMCYRKPEDLDWMADGSTKWNSEVLESGGLFYAGGRLRGGWSPKVWSPSTGKGSNLHFFTSVYVAFRHTRQAGWKKNTLGLQGGWGLRFSCWPYWLCWTFSLSIQNL